MPSAEFVEVILAKGHENIVSTHKTTLEITKDTHLTRMGDCIVAVGANKSVQDLSDDFKKHLIQDSSKLTLRIESGGVSDVVTAVGNQGLTLTHPSDMVVRKSLHVCGRTLAVNADKAAGQLSRELVNQLKNPQQAVKIILSLSV